MSRRPVPASPGFRQFLKEEIEHSLPARLEQQVERHPDRLAVQTYAQESGTISSTSAETP